QGARTRRNCCLAMLGGRRGGACTAWVWCMEPGLAEHCFDRRARRFALVVFGLATTRSLPWRVFPQPVRIRWIHAAHGPTERHCRSDPGIVDRQAVRCPPTWLLHAG